MGQASNFPGKVALKIQKNFIKYFKLKNNLKIILITGTNGKSTTTGMLASILKASGKKVTYNKFGANLLAGVASTLIQSSNLFGSLDYDFIILEIDEATLPLLTSLIKANVIAVTNFFRDQLDRFGELDTTVKLIEKGITNNKDAILILNADDPRVAFLNANNKKIYYGVNKGGFEVSRFRGLEVVSGQNNDDISNIWNVDPEEITSCPECKSNLIFKYKTLAHLGDYKCSKCDLKKPDTNFTISNTKTDNLSTYFDINYDDHKNNFFISLVGIFNLYNTLCSIAIAKTISDVTNVQIQKGFQSYSTIFGRGEKIRFKNKLSWIYLIKNPTGATEVLKLLTQIPNSRFLIALNDNLADGRDISWIWDARFDLLSNHKKEIFVSGKRAFDMALRLKYAGINEHQIKTNEKLLVSLKGAIKSLSENETLYILPTYTVLLEMQQKGICSGYKI